MILIATILVVVLSFVHFYMKTKRKVKLAERFPGPDAHPIFGNIFNFTFDDTLGKRFASFNIAPIKWIF